MPPALNPTIPTGRQLPRVPRCREPVRPVLARADPRCRPAPAYDRARTSCPRGATTPTRAEALATSWGFRIQPGEVHLRRFHDRVECSVVADRRTILDVALVDPEPITGHDIQYSRRHAPRARRRATTADAAADRAGRHRVRVPPRRPRAAGARDVRRRQRGATIGSSPSQPVSASFTACDMTITPVRYVCNPDIPASEGTQRVGNG